MSNGLTDPNIALVAAQPQFSNRLKNQMAPVLNELASGSDQEVEAALNSYYQGFIEDSSTPNFLERHGQAASAFLRNYLVEQNPAAAARYAADFNDYGAIETSLEANARLPIPVAESDLIFLEGR